MEPHFWIQAWKEGRTNFHRDSYHDKLTEYFPKLHPQKGQKVLVPLCGKTKDLLWLESQGLDVHGVELYEEAAKAFFSENKLPSPSVSRETHFTHFAHKNITISCGDFFKLEASASYDLIYDRGSLVALPAPMRKKYAEAIRCVIKKGGKYLLIAYEYEPSQMEGPPFSVSETEIRSLYADSFTIQQMESKRPSHEGPRLAAVESLRQQVYILTSR
jgi:thiopurine S-methyltransferase